MQIGMVAKKIGLSVDAIRFYERNALLRRAPRTEGGFRRYGEEDLETLAFIRRVQRPGFKRANESPDVRKSLLAIRHPRARFRLSPAVSSMTGKPSPNSGVMAVRKRVLASVLVTVSFRVSR